MPITFISHNASARDTRPRKASTVLFVDGPIDARSGIERELGTADLKVVWADSSTTAIAELRLREMPVLVGFSRGVAALKFIS